MGLNSGLSLLQYAGKLGDDIVAIGARRLTTPKVEPKKLRYVPELYNNFRFNRTLINDVVEISNPVNWLPKWKQRGFKLPEITSKIDFTKEGLSASRALRNESRIPPEVKVPQSFIDGDLGVKILDNGNLWGNARCEIMQIDFLHDKTLMNIIEKFKSKLAQNKNATEEEKINLLMNYVDDLFSVSKNDGEILKLTEKFPANKVVNLGEIIDSGAGVCRHRALLLKILGDKSNMSVSLVKGCYDDGHHAWNEIITKSVKNIWLILCIETLLI